MIIFRSLRTKLLVVCLLLSVIPIAISGIFVFAHMKEKIKTHAIEDRSGSLLQKAQTVTEFIKRMKTQASVAGGYPPIQGLIRSETTGKDDIDGSTYELWITR